MKNSRRDFLKQASLLAGGAGMLHTLPPSIKRALAINPNPGTTFYDAEHIVLLMQENRSFDHLYGTLQGVRGFNDPRAIKLPNHNLAWLQTNKKGETYAPFRLNIKDTNATWMSSLPHSWQSQVDARHDGRYNNWLNAKRSGNKEYANMPLTLGHYIREDLPFYYALADAFTVCDQHFCSCLTGTTPNRLYYWTGTIREKQNGDSPANVDNSDVDYGNPASWLTFPEVLESNDISWKIYQNELSVGVGFNDDEDAWLANFTDNPIEWFSQYHVRFLPAHISYMKQRAAMLEKEIQTLAAGSSDEKNKKQRLLDRINAALSKFTPENFSKLSQHEQNLHNKAFVTNANDPEYHELTTLEYDDNGTQRKLLMPKSDALFQFREDVNQGNLPAVSWLVASENFSDHPGAPWYGAWYVSEVMDILTKNPEVWKKTIFILTYDENDGYFDHVPPFTAPDPDDRKSGFCSKGIDTTVEYVTKKQAEALKGEPKDPQRVSPIGLGYRVPFVVASPWSRGGWVNSQVFDNTSVLKFLENFLTNKTGKGIQINNISEWRRSICGDLTSVFRPYNGEQIKLPGFIDEKNHIENIYNAKFKEAPSDFKLLNKEEIKAINENPLSSAVLSKQESGIRSSCPLPYQIYADGMLDKDKKSFEIQLEAGNEFFGKQAAGVPFTIYDLNDFSIRNYAVAAGDTLTDNWGLNSHKDDYHICIYAPNGFFREFKGNRHDPDVTVQCEYERKRLNNKKPNGNITLQIHNTSNQQQHISIRDNAYNNSPSTSALKPGESISITLPLGKSHGWYDFSLQVKGKEHFTRRYAGHVETGESSFTDPLMGRVTG
ncbi:MAG: phospholipase C, phosphocholine-specific [Chitinophagaceae bacterium]|nr:MAG: phospholipase C, phosphocholine-specific [Chitinophagaceae bacterium]